MGHSWHVAKDVQHILEIIKSGANIIKSGKLVVTDKAGNTLKANVKVK